MSFEIYLEGNKGGDYFQLKHVDGEDTVELEVGHCCVKSINHKVPVEFLTSALTEISLEYGIRGFLKKYWGEENFKKMKLHNKIRKLK